LTGGFAATVTHGPGAESDPVGGGQVEKIREEKIELTGNLWNTPVMSENDKASEPVSSAKRRARKLRLAGSVILAIGIIAAGIVYWLGTRSPDSSDDLSMTGYDRAETRQMEILYGKQGELIEDWSNDLKQPGTQAMIIIVTAALIAGGCFYFARLSDYDDETR
jgi:hypothetical protein